MAWAFISPVRMRVSVSRHLYNYFGHQKCTAKCTVKFYLRLQADDCGRPPGMSRTFYHDLYQWLFGRQQTGVNICERRCGGPGR